MTPPALILQPDLFPETYDISAEDGDERYTPHALFDPLNAEFRFNLDVCATAESAKCERFFTKADDGLAQSWRGARVWCNPPWSDIEPWVLKAWCSGAALVGMLLPATRTDMPWWQRWVEPYRDEGSPVRWLAAPCRYKLISRFLPGRQVFGYPGNPEGLGQGSPPFGVVLLIWSAA